MLHVSKTQKLKLQHENYVVFQLLLSAVRPTLMPSQGLERKRCTRRRHALWVSGHASWFYTSSAHQDVSTLSLWSFIKHEAPPYRKDQSLSSGGILLPHNDV